MSRNRRRHPAPPAAPVSQPELAAPALTVEITLDNLLIGDLALLERFDRKEHTQSELVAFLDRVVVGGAAQLPIRQLGAVMRALGQALSASSNPKN